MGFELVSYFVSYIKVMLIVHKYRKLSNLIESFIQMVILFSTLHPNHFKQIFYYYYYYYYNLLTPWCRVLLEKLTGLQLVKKFPAFHGTPRFITALTSVHHLSLSWPSPIQSIYPHTTSWRSILILSTHLRLGLPSGLLPSGFPTKTLYTPLSSPIRATCPAHLILLDFITRTILGDDYKSFSSLLCHLLHSPVTSSLLGPNTTTKLLLLLQHHQYKYILFLQLHSLTTLSPHPLVHYDSTGG